MTIEQKIELLFGTVILAVLGYLASNQFDMKGTLSTVSTKVESTDQRVSRIADTLPDIKARIAWEEINYPLAGFVAATVPVETKGNKWITSVNVYDAKTGSLKSWEIKLDKNHKDYAAFVLAGIVRSNNPYNTSFAELAHFSGKEKTPVSIPAFINAHTSFIIRTGGIDEYAMYLQQMTSENPTVKALGPVKKLARGRGKVRFYTLNLVPHVARRPLKKHLLSD